MKYEEIIEVVMDKIQAKRKESGENLKYICAEITSLQLYKTLWP